jgi:hypothetical protein
MDYWICIFLTGVGATLLIDLWAIARRHLLGIPLPNYRLLGRWLGHMPRGRFRHDAIAAALPVKGEGVIGWIAHYLTGIAFAAIVPGLWGPTWFHHPSIGPALLVGLANRPWAPASPQAAHRARR